MLAINKRKLLVPGIEPGMQLYKNCVIPFHHTSGFYARDVKYIFYISLILINNFLNINYIFNVFNIDLKVTETCDDKNDKKNDKNHTNINYK